MNDPRQNRLLAALPANEYEHLVQYLELVPLPLGHVLYESGVQMHHVYFPTTAIVSLLYITREGEPTEVSLVGKEGVVGVSLFMGGATTPSRGVVQSAGHAYRLQVQVLLDEFDRIGGRRIGVLHKLLLRYTQALLTQMAQTAVCNRHHALDQQLCRWLLMSLDCLPSGELAITQELIANLLGVRRESVTETAGHLQKSGLISYNRGHITVLNRAGLEARVCECYKVVKAEYDRLFPAAIVPQSAARRRKTPG